MPSTPSATFTPSSSDHRLFLVLLLGLLVVLQLPLPFRLAGLALVLGAGWVGFRLLRDLRAQRRAGRPTRGALSVSVGLGLVGMMGLSLAADAIYYPLSVDHERCLAVSNTLAEQEACREEQQRRISELQERLRRDVGMP